MQFWKQFQPGFTCLAPMEGVTDIAFRQVVAKAARPDIFFTEFTNVNSYNSDKGRHNALDRFQTLPSEKPIVAQIWGTKPEFFTETAQGRPSNSSVLKQLILIWAVRIVMWLRPVVAQA